MSCWDQYSERGKSTKQTEQKTKYLPTISARPDVNQQKRIDEQNSEQKLKAGHLATNSLIL